MEAYRELVCEATFEPGVEAYLAMRTQWYKIMRSHYLVCSFCVCLLGMVMIVYTCMYMFGCLVNGVCMYDLAVVLAFWSTTGIISLESV